MMHLYIYTPPLNNSDFTPHLIEHCVFGKTDINNFFKFEKITASCSTYYTYYIIDTDDMIEVEQFIKMITTKIGLDIINYEYQVIKEECLKPSYIQELTGKVGKYLYGEEFTYMSVSKLIYDDIYTYHQKWYKRENIHILEKNTKYSTEQIDIKLKLYKENKFEIDGEIENVFIYKHDLNEYYAISLLAGLFDYYIKYKLRYYKGIYEYGKYSTVISDYKDYFYLSIHSEMLNIIQEINNDFISKYIENSINNKEYLADKNLDGSFIIQYGYTLSDADKKSILHDIQEIYVLFKSKF